MINRFSKLAFLFSCTTVVVFCEVNRAVVVFVSINHLYSIKNDVKIQNSNVLNGNVF